MKFKFLAILAAASFICIRCIDEIKLNIDDDQQRLVVDGFISDSLQVHAVKVSHSAVIGVGNDNILTPVSGATVRVLDEAGGSIGFFETKEGVYTREMKGEVGRAYHVEVKLPDGKTILSQPEVLKKAPPIGPVTANVVDESYLSSNGRFISAPKLVLRLSTTATGFVRWRSEAEYEFKEGYPMALNTKLCYVKNTVDLNNISIYDASQFAGGQITDQQVLKTDYNYRFADMFCFHLFQFAISEAEYKYWQGVKDIVNIDGSLFDPPPGTVRGNLYFADNPDELVLGYFSVAGVAYKREFLNSQTIGIYMERRCHGLSFRPTVAECFQCLNIPNSTLVKPAYWIP